LKWLLLRRRRLGEVGDVAALEHVLPVLPIEISVLDLRDCATVDAGHRDRHAVRVGPRRVEGCDAADLAEGMLRRVGAEGVGGDELLGAVLKLELGGGHDEVDVTAHVAVGAVADPRHQACRGLHLPPHAPAVAAAAVDDVRDAAHRVIRERSTAEVVADLWPDGFPSDRALTGGGNRLGETGRRDGGCWAGIGRQDSGVLRGAGHFG
jgi:hypothetical protein